MLAQVCEWVSGWMDGIMNVLMGGWIDLSVGGLAVGWVCQLMDGWMDNRWIDEQD